MGAYIKIGSGSNQACFFYQSMHIYFNALIFSPRYANEKYKKIRLKFNKLYILTSMLMSNQNHYSKKLARIYFCKT